MSQTRINGHPPPYRYTKALEEVRRCRKEKLKEVQELDKASAVMGEQKAQADKLQAELKDLQAKMATIQVWVCVLVHLSCRVGIFLCLLAPM